MPRNSDNPVLKAVFYISSQLSFSCFKMNVNHFYHTLKAIENLLTLQKTFPPTFVKSSQKGIVTLIEKTTCQYGLFKLLGFLYL